MGDPREPLSRLQALCVTDSPVPATAMDPAIVSAQRPNAVYTRAQLLALHASPLVPTKLDGMKDLAEWHGCAAKLPPAPLTRAPT